MHHERSVTITIKFDGTIQLQVGSTALHLASQKGHIAIVRLLIEAGVSLDVQTNVSFLQKIVD